VIENSTPVARNIAAPATATERVRSSANGTIGSAARDRRADQAEHRGGSPGVPVAAQDADQHQRARRGGEQRCAGHVEPVVGAAGRGRGEPAAQGLERDEAEWQVDVEHPAPAGTLDEGAAQQRPDDRRDGEGGRDVALVATALARGDEVADRRHGERHQAARGDALHAAQHDELGDVLCRAAERGCEHEAAERDLEQPLAAMPVAELAPQRRGRGSGDDVGGDDPRDIAEAAEVGGDDREGRRKDRLVEDGREHREDDRGERDRDRLSSAVWGGAVVRMGPDGVAAHSVAPFAVGLVLSP
jgi:hypothetical protein